MLKTTALQRANPNQAQLDEKADTHTPGKSLDNCQEELCLNLDFLADINIYQNSFENDVEKKKKFIVSH